MITERLITRPVSSSQRHQSSSRKEESFIETEIEFAHYSDQTFLSATSPNIFIHDLPKHFYLRASKMVLPRQNFAFFCLMAFTIANMAVAQPPAPRVNPVCKSPSEKPYCVQVLTDNNSVTSGYWIKDASSTSKGAAVCSDSFVPTGACCPKGTQSFPKSTRMAPSDFNKNGCRLK